MRMHEGADHGGILLAWCRRLRHAHHRFLMLRREATGLVFLTGGWRWRLTCVNFGFLRLDLPRAIVPIAGRSGARLYAESQRDSVETTSRVELKARDSRINNAYVRWRTMYTTTLCLPSTWVVRR